MEKHFRDILMDVQQKCGLKTVLLERKLAQMTTEYERLETVLAEVLKLTGVEPQELCAKVETFLRQKNERIDQLELDLARVAKAYEDLLDVYEGHLEKIGVPKSTHDFHSVDCLAPHSFRRGSSLVKSDNGYDDKNRFGGEKSVISGKTAKINE